MVVDVSTIKAKDRLLLAMLPHVLFDGWSHKALNAGLREIGEIPEYSNDDLFVNLIDMAIHFGEYIDREMLIKLGVLELEKMPIRERIATGIRVRLNLLSPYKGSIQRLLAFLALPGNHLTGLRITMKTVDSIWYAAGDTATDFNYYTKRGLLAGVYGSTVLFWLSDVSEGHADTSAFLARRINEVMQIPKIQSKVSQKIECFTRPLRGFIYRIF
jgi:ubiquinone biosynthesis protein COQ9